MTSKNLFSNEINMLDPITVTGNLFPKKIKETGTSVTIIDKKEIKESGKKFLSEIFPKNLVNGIKIPLNIFPKEINLNILLPYILTN